MEWILIKGIKDYVNGDQPSSDEWGVFASVMAASVVAKILHDPVLFQNWCHYSGGKRSQFLSPSFLRLNAWYRLANFEVCNIVTLLTAYITPFMLIWVV